jgi:hypothetical protein
MGIISVFILHPAFANAAASSDYIETIGTARADPTLVNITQRQATACEAAITQAQAQMLFKLKQTGILKGAEVVRTEWLTDEQCRVTLRLDKNRSTENNLRRIQ